MTVNGINTSVPKEKVRNMGIIFSEQAQSSSFWLCPLLNEWLVLTKLYPH